MKQFLSLWAVALCLISGQLRAQQASPIEFYPPTFGLDDTLTISYDAGLGNGALAGYDSDIYIHTGVIMGTPEEPSGWRFVQGNWGTDDPKVKMKRSGDDRYYIRFLVRDFYGIEGDEEKLLQIVCVFRNETGDLVGKTADNKDFYYPEIKMKLEGALQDVSGKDGVFLGNITTVEKARNGSVILHTDNKYTVQLDFYAKDILRVSYIPNGSSFRSESDAIVFAATDLAQPGVVETADNITVTWGSEKSAVITRKPLRITYFHKGTKVLSDTDGLFQDTVENVMGVRFGMQPGERMFGTGSRALDPDRRGQRVYTYNAPKYAYSTGAKTLNMSIPYVLSSNKYGILFDNTANGYIDLGRDDKNTFEYATVDKRELSYYLIIGDNPADITSRYTDLTGHQPMPPMWALGYIQSRFGYQTEAETREIVGKTLDAGIPLEGTLLDLYWFGDKSRMGDLSWEKKQWPTPEKMIADFSARGVKTILISESYFVKGTRYWKELDQKGYFAKNLDGNGTFLIKDFWAGPAALLDVFNPAATDWYWELYKKQLQIGVAGWWCDSGEPENHPKKMSHQRGPTELIHNIYQTYWAKMIYDGYKKDFPDSRIFNLSRSGYAGIQRYGILPWSGDVSRGWEGLVAQPQIMLGAGVCGIGYMHSDIGGFTNGPKNPELFLRWLQYGAFTPVMRVHGEGIAPEPIFYDAKTLEVAKKNIQLRYALLPYNYNLVFENNLKGWPLARPMYFHYPNEDKIANAIDQYMWGENLMVLPVLKPEQTEATPYLPAGKWVNFFTEEVYEGSSKRLVKVDPDYSPVLVKGGSFIPTLPPVRNTSQYTGDTLIVNYYPFKALGKTSYTLHTDDGKTPESVEKNQFATLVFTGEPVASNKEDLLTMTISQNGNYQGMPANRLLLIEVHGIVGKPLEVKFGDAKLKPSTGVKQDFLRTVQDNGYYWDPVTKILYAKVRYANATSRFTVKGKAILR